MKTNRLLAFVSLPLVLLAAKGAQAMMHNYEIANTVEARRVDAGFRFDDFENAAWAKARPAHIARYWSGEAAPPERRAEARLVYTDEAIMVRFEGPQAEPLVVSAAPRLDQKSIGLWDRDVFEIFIAPDSNAPERYFEFEAAPNGEWLDLAIHVRPEGRETDWHFRSGMRSASRVSNGRVETALRVPWKALGGRAPRAGERWRVNLFRCVGAGATRGYITWQPTHTPEPGFHVPEKFGWLVFK
ncbi:MAG TPA: carbohydrate-binding family 9-like protein [Pyrinomonadaceae bacterium]|nr:carbohydrate-binding family 9-like protein [Pyrinomonadaceae bacterium]